MGDEPLMENRVRERRRLKGWSQQELADRSGLSRAGVGAIESGRLSPSTASALALAAAFGCAVEDLFRLRSPAPVEADGAWSEPPSPAEGRRYWKAEVDGRIRAYPVEFSPLGLPPHDGVYRGGVFEDLASASAEQTLVLATCDPAVGLLANALGREHGVRLLVLNRSSRSALALLARGIVHAAGVHLSPVDSPGGNADAAQASVAGDRPLRILRAAEWEDGIALTPRLATASLREVLSASLRWVGREPGSAARDCLDELLGDAQSRGGATIPGLARDHRGVAAAVRDGWADAGVCHRLASEEAGLPFLRVRREAYDLIYPDSLQSDPRLRALVKAVRSAEYRKRLSDLPGCDAESSGGLDRLQPGR